MSTFSVSFTIDGKLLGSLVEVLQPYKVGELNFKLVTGTATKIRAGDMTALELVVKLADQTPRPLNYFRQGLVAAGFNYSTVAWAVRVMVKRKALTKKLVNGKPHYTRTK